MKEKAQGKSTGANGGSVQRMVRLPRGLAKAYPPTTAGAVARYKKLQEQLHSEELTAEDFKWNKPDELYPDSINNLNDD